MKKILVTGAGGFVGSRILQQWSRNDALYTLPKGFFRTAGEAQIMEQVEKICPDVILHTALSIRKRHIVQTCSCRSGWRKQPQRPMQS